ncbi:hypothetical protein N9344_00660, partial [bacterium]|nr:hypothetical protein [bacterium]
NEAEPDPKPGETETTEDQYEHLLDFNRSKDGTIRKESPNLAIPSLTYDYYNVTGQGTGGMFRPYRSDIGVIYDPYVKSNTFGGAAGTDLGLIDHWGVSLSITSGNSTSGIWHDDNDLEDLYAFKGSEADSDPGYEPLYYKMHGEMTSFEKNEMDFVGGERPVRAELQKGGTIKKPVSGKLIYEGGESVVGLNSYRNKKRMPRNTSVQPLTNKQMGGSNEVVGEYDIKYYEYSPTPNLYPYQSEPTKGLNRSERGEFSKSITDHVGGVTSLNTEGARYVYGLPAYNKVDETYNFSVTNEACHHEIDVPIKNGKVDNEAATETNKYIDKTELPAYAYSYLLTSVLGNDYVDSDTELGPSDGDMGYWVKFNYVQTNDDYKWRAPFTKANYNKGLLSTVKDNTASFKYGEKEVYHVATVETKTHIAVYHISQRDDAKGALDRLVNSNTDLTNNSSSYKLDKISLYVKKEYQDNGENAVPIKQVHFEYDYSLSSGVPNSVTGSKLTLKRVYFTYQNNNRGELSPYVFNYDDTSAGYDLQKYDRWGNYKSDIETDYCDILNSPYVKQFETIDVDLDDKRAKDVSVWHLTEIELPTGGKLKVDYEADDYGYVQHKVAQQMFKINGLGSPGNPDIYTNDHDSDRKVYFNLEQTLDPPGTTSNQIFYNKYIKDLLVDGKYQMYYKIKVRLKDNNH